MTRAPERLTADDKRQLRNALGRFATGVAVITTKTSDGKLEGLTVNSFSAVSLEPPLVLWSLQKQAPSLPSFSGAGQFAINILSLDQRDICRHFATRSRNKFQGLAYDLGRSGCPVLMDSLAIFECSTHSVVEGGDHLIFIGRIQYVACRDGQPLVFSGGELCALTALPDPCTASEPRDGLAMVSECRS